LLLLLLAGCAVAPGPNHFDRDGNVVWRGRLAVRLEPDQSQTQAQSLSAEFELSGDAQQGQLTLFTPFGTTLAVLAWSDQSATLRAEGGTRHFDSLAGLSQEVLGTEVPVVALFAWLAGEALEMAGWQADLSQYAAGLITAQRTQPLPLAQLRIILENN